MFKMWVLGNQLVNIATLRSCSHKNLSTFKSLAFRRFSSDSYYQTPHYRRFFDQHSSLHHQIPHKHGTSQVLCHRKLSTSHHQLRNLKPSVGFRPTADDHRGNISPDNRPEDEFKLSEENAESNILDDAAYASLLHDAEGFGAGVVVNAGLSGSMFVILPWIKWGPQQKSATTSQLLLDEACALADSVNDVTVVDKEIVKIRFEAKSTVFGTGQLLMLGERIRNLRGLATVFVSVDTLHMITIRMLEQQWGVRVVDRYWLVLSIFHQHARTPEARMQVALAELPYIKRRTRHDNERAMIDERIKRIKVGLRKLQRHREHIRRKRDDREFPSIAVVGYTNTGKTSMISALSGDGSIKGRDQLFATLDVTAHGVQLPCGLRSVLIDTVGFIQDLPTALVASFNATLQDAAQADVVLHVRDLSHPDRLMHHTTVMAALYSINLPHTTPIITLDNKADLVAGTQHESEGSWQTVRGATVSAGIGHCVSHLSQTPGHRAYYRKESDEAEEDLNSAAVLIDESEMTKKERLHFLKEQYHSTPSLIVSAKTKKGLLNVLHAVENQILQVTDRQMYRMKLPTGGSQLRELRRIVGFPNETILDDTPEKTLVVTAMTQKQLAMFKKRCREIAGDAVVR